MSAATAGSVCLANPAVLPRPIEHFGRPYQSRPSAAFTEIFGRSAHLQKFPDKSAEWPHYEALSDLHTRCGAEQHGESDPGAGRRVSPLRAINGGTSLCLKAVEIQCIRRKSV